ncbi:hypothetical protein OPV22_007459 [Ensete ventricosum]|uniref:Uncharacterized protein n=1 Tax=Ensete ventricosum TaxID=4639 RepID=A0AAV8RRR9_ENSVE|nr:hypothetical protein OPV22_007459 [Ensete ventricosum]
MCFRCASSRFRGSSIIRRIRFSANSITNFILSFLILSSLTLPLPATDVDGDRVFFSFQPSAIVMPGERFDSSYIREGEP